jgi:enolase
MSIISKLSAREILDSRGNPTVEVTCVLESGIVGVCAVPSGASTGSHEAFELRDGDMKRFNGLGVLKAVNHVNQEIHSHLAGREFHQTTLDGELILLDATERKSKLGANAMLGVSLAFAKAQALDQKKELFEYLADFGGGVAPAIPQPMFNVINGGKHADSGLDIQEFMLAPLAFSSCSEKIRVGSEVVTQLKKILHAKGFAVSVGDEGGFAPKLSSNEEAFTYIEEAIQSAGYTTTQIKIAIDAAASSFYTGESYKLKIAGVSKNLSSGELVSWYETLAREHPLMAIEDGLAEDDFKGFAYLRAKLGSAITIVGDDVTVTNKKRITKAYNEKAINSVLIKPNQIGTLSETIDAIHLTKKYGWMPFVSHRSGETTDTFIADLAVGLACPYIKAGSLTRGERVCKYNRLMEIENLLALRKVI